MKTSYFHYKYFFEQRQTSQAVQIFYVVRCVLSLTRACAYFRFVNLPFLNVTTRFSLIHERFCGLLKRACILSPGACHTDGLPVAT